MILVVNTGSSSIKAALFEQGLRQVAAVTLAGIGENSNAVLIQGNARRSVKAVDHHSGIKQILQALTNHPIRAAAHRVVHGGTALTEPCKITPDVIAQIRANIPLAPLHNPPALAGIEALANAEPDLPQFASFDTAFHASQPELATTYALPAAQRAAGLQRYGFHGLSYASMADQFGANIPQRLLAFHLGNGASLCAIKNGKSCATSMGYSPLDGLTMGTRSGAIDGMAVLRLAEELGLDGAARLLNSHSGLVGLAGTNDMRTLLQTNSDEARFAVDHFCYWAARHAGSAIVAMGGVDALAFTGGIGENSPEIRDRIMAKLSFFGELPVHVIPAEEERQIARDALRLNAL